jgi:hypothetical protein
MKKSNNIRELTILTGLLIINLLFSFAVYSEEKEESSNLLTYLLGGAGTVYFLNNQFYQKNLKLKESISAKESEIKNLKSLGRDGLSSKCLPFLRQIAFNIHEKEGVLLSEVEAANKERVFKLNTPVPLTVNKEQLESEVKEKPEELTKLLEQAFKESPEYYIQALKLDGALSPLGAFVRYPVDNGLTKAIGEQLSKLSKFSDYRIVKLAKLPYDIVYWFSKQLSAWVVMPVFRGVMNVPIVSGTVLVVKENHSLALLIGAFLLGDYLDNKRDANNLKTKELIESIKVLEDVNDPKRKKLEENLLDLKIKNNASQTFFNMYLLKKFWTKTAGLGQNFESGDSGLGKFPFELNVTGYAVNADVEYLDKLYGTVVHQYIQKIKNTPQAGQITSSSAVYKLIVSEVFKQILVEKFPKELEKHFGKDYLKNEDFTKFIEVTLNKYIDFLNEEKK